ncbi:hypothetical protein [Pedobacter psychrodurus]|uniref:hypothetical protein n=1 Tax=Pedobacter psychrodurus TaxID=2530456 RepID=UPI0013F16D99|nr:hypothetical protein [Pedobacter psychrodurus]
MQKELPKIPEFGITDNPNLVCPPEDKAQSAAAFCHEIFYISRNIIYDTEADLVFLGINDADHQFIV